MDVGFGRDILFLFYLLFFGVVGSLGVGLLEGSFIYLLMVDDVCLLGRYLGCGMKIVYGFYIWFRFF